MLQFGNLKSFIFINLSSLSIIGCALAPGMHVENPVEHVNQKGELITPKIQEINSKFIQNKMNKEKMELSIIKQTYKTPEGFSQDPKGYTYRIGAQDVLSIVVWDHPNLTNPIINDGVHASKSVQTNISTSVGITVDHNGNIFYPYIGEINVLGLTIPEVRALITKKLGIFLRNPQINVLVNEFNSQKIAVVGTVVTPKVISITNTPLTVLNAITLTGGPIRCGVNQSNNVNETECSDLTSVTVKRGNKIVNVDLTSLESPNGTSENWILMDGDVVNVPSNIKSQVFVIGAINAPGPYNIPNGILSLRDVIGVAKGFSNQSLPDYTYIIRDFNGEPEVYSINLRSPDSLLLAGQFNLKPKDIVYASKSKLVQFNEVIALVTPSMTSINQGVNTAVGIKILSN
jgi:polysaccharide export outer membrane protein